MARKKSFEAQLLDNLTKVARSGGGRGRGKGPGGVWGVLLTLLLVVLFSWLQTRDGGDAARNGDSSSRPSAESSVDETLPDVPDAETVEIERCVDGDTFVVRLASGATERVRLIGANTPETVKPNSPIEPFGPEASEFSKRRVEEAGGRATLVADGDRRDRYDRRLAFVYLADSQISLNEELARVGLAKVETKYRYSAEMKRRLVAAENAAKKDGLGIHSLAP